MYGRFRHGAAQGKSRCRRQPASRADLAAGRRGTPRNARRKAARRAGSGLSCDNSMPPRRLRMRQLQQAGMLEGRDDGPCRADCEGWRKGQPGESGPDLYAPDLYAPPATDPRMASVTVDVRRRACQGQGHHDCATAGPSFHRRCPLRPHPCRSWPDPPAGRPHSCPGHGDRPHRACQTPAFPGRAPDPCAGAFGIIIAEPAANCDPSAYDQPGWPDQQRPDRTATYPRTTPDGPCTPQAPDQAAPAGPVRNPSESAPPGTQGRTAWASLSAATPPASRR